MEDNELRKEVWPYLLGFYKFEAVDEQNQRHLDQTQTKYESSVTDWLSVEAIVKQRDIEAFKAGECHIRVIGRKTEKSVLPFPARQARESRYSDIPLVGKQSISLSNDVVFESEDDEIDEYLATDTVPSSRAVAKRSKTAKLQNEGGKSLGETAEPIPSVTDSDSGICALGEFKEELKSIGEANELGEDLTSPSQQTDKSADSVIMSPGTTSNTHQPVSARSSNELPEVSDLRQRKMFYVTDSGRSTPEEGDGGIFSVSQSCSCAKRLAKSFGNCRKN